MTNSDTAEIRMGKTVVVDTPLHKRQPGGVNPTISASDPNAPRVDEAVVASFANRADADKAVAALVAENIARDSVTVLDGPEQKRAFLKGYVHHDSDRHTHSQVGSAFFALGGAFALGLIGVLIATWYTQGGTMLIVAALVGGLIGAALGSLLGGVAMRPADDRSIDLAESLSKEGTLVAVRTPLGSSNAPLDEAGRILSRHNARAFRLKEHISQADLHPGDTRTKAD
ncbi:MAG: hypothetical protein H0T47_04140 [Planctomycetaceae bacterium]|nr:hypothetical protein [Planctomycetaceae bacterium]